MPSGENNIIHGTGVLYQILLGKPSLNPAESIRESYDKRCWHPNDYRKRALRVGLLPNQRCCGISAKKRVRVLGAEPGRKVEQALVSVHQAKPNFHDRQVGEAERLAPGAHFESPSVAYCSLHTLHCGTFSPHAILTLPKRLS
eukprot:640686-Prorocentrum_minimum.AAC.1